MTLGHLEPPHRRDRLLRRGRPRLQLPPRRAARRAAALAPARGSSAEIERRRELTRALPRAARRRRRTSIVPYDDAGVARSSCYVMPILVEDDGRRDAVAAAPARRARHPDVVFYPAVHEFTAYRERFGGSTCRTPSASRAPRSRSRSSPTSTRRRRTAWSTRSRRRSSVSWTIPLTDVVITESDVEAVADCLRVRLADDGPAHAGASRRRSPSGPARRTPSPSRAAPRRCTSRAARSTSAPATRSIVPALHVRRHRQRAALHAAPTPVLCDVESPAAPEPRRRPPSSAASRRARARSSPCTFCGYPADLGPLRELCDERGLALSRTPPRPSAPRSSPGARPAPSARSAASRSSPRSSSAWARAGWC